MRKWGSQGSAEKAFGAQRRCLKTSFNSNPDHQTFGDSDGKRRSGMGGGQPPAFGGVISPCIWTRNSVLILRAASLSFSLLEPHRESISSMKMMDGRCSLAKAKRFFTSLERDKCKRRDMDLSSCFWLRPRRKNSTLTFHSPPATWTPSRRRTQRRRWSCWLLSQPPWLSRIFPFQGGQTEGSPAKEFAFLHRWKQHFC